MKHRVMTLMSKSLFENGTLDGTAILYKWIPQKFFADLMSYISRGVKVRSGLGLGIRSGLGLEVRLGLGLGVRLG